MTELPKGLRGAKRSKTSRFVVAAAVGVMTAAAAVVAAAAAVAGRGYLV